MMVVLVSIDMPFCLWYGDTLNPNHPTDFVSDFIYFIKLMVYYSDHFFGFTGVFFKSIQYNFLLHVPFSTYILFCADASWFVST